MPAIMKSVSWKPDGGIHLVISWGNGLAYEIRDELNGGSVFLQGDDAADWRHEYDKADAAGQLETFLADTIQEYRQ